MAGVNIVRIPYSGAGPAVNSVIGNQVQLMFATSGSVAPHIKSGRLKALAVTTRENRPHWCLACPRLPRQDCRGMKPLQ